MRIGILEAGQNRDMLERRHGAYSNMFQALLSPHDPSLTFATYAAFDGVLPALADECDAWIVTGSRDTAFERLGWMTRLEAFLREAMIKARPVAGICFGHQILAQAMGGAVERAAVGWGLGIHSYSTIAPPPAWMANAPETVCLSAVHRDQVTCLPPEARVVASSPFCPAAILAYGNRAITFQGHPEFSLSFVSDLLDELAQEGLAENLIARACADVRNPQARTDSALVARWILAFFADRY